MADETAAVWVQKVLRKAVAEYMDSQIKAISHTDSKCVSAKDRPVITFRNFIRDKVHWMPEKIRGDSSIRAFKGRRSDFVVRTLSV